MPYNKRVKDGCTSPDMTIIHPINIFHIQKILELRYEDMASEKLKKQALITITCKGFYNPIERGLMRGYDIAVFDNELFAHSIWQSNDIPLNTINYEPAKIRASQISIRPTIERINQYSTWTLFVNEFPMPLNQDFFVELIIPSDLGLDIRKLEGNNMFVDRNEIQYS